MTVEKFSGTFDALFARLTVLTGGGAVIHQVLKLKGGEYIILIN